MTNEEAIKRIQHVIDNKLTELDLSGCDLPLLQPKELVDEAGKYVTSLKIRSARINAATISLIAQSFPLLTWLDVRYNGLNHKGAREIAANLKSLTRLDIGFNEIGDEGAREIAADLKGLTQLNISHNKIDFEGVLEITANLKGLTQLDINDNSIGDEGAREIAANLKGLTRLDISGNKIGDEGAREIAINLKGLTQLDISFNSISETGARELATNLRRLTRLDIGGNDVGDGGALEIATKLKNLRRLAIGANDISNPGAKGIAINLRELTDLEIGFNSIGAIGAREIALNMKQLVSLDITDNNIGARGAKEIATNLKELRQLYISDNNIGDEGAREIAVNQKELIQLSVRGNNIGDYGAIQLASFRLKLKHLDLRSNAIADEGHIALAIAPSLLYSNIYLADNKPHTIPKDVAEDIGALREYLKTDLVPGNVLRIVLCGNTLAGKTTLAGKLNDVNTKNPDIADRTHGIRHWCILPTDKQESFILNIWDFGGQDYYHATHAASLSSENKDLDNKLTIYLPVWRTSKPTSREEDCQQFNEDYWLGFIQLLAGKPDILLVQTFADVDAPAFPQSSLMGSYFNLTPDCYQYLQLGAATFGDTKGLRLWDQFSKQLYRKVQQKLSDSALKIPEAWPKLRQHVIPDIMKGRVVMGRDELKETLLCSNVLNGNYKKEVDLAYEALLPYLRGCGDIMYWKEVKEGQLKDRIIVNIEKFHREIYEELLTDKIRVEQKGEFTPSADHAFHVAYLKYHELIFKKEKNTEIYVAPQYLPEQPLADHFRDLMPLTLVLKFPHYMPRYLITRLIVRAYNKDNSTHYWKYGCISKWTNGATTTKFMVAIDTELQTVSFYIQDTRDRYEVLKKLFQFFASFGVYDPWKDEKLLQANDDKLLLREEKPENKLPEEITDALQVCTDGRGYEKRGLHSLIKQGDHEATKEEKDNRRFVEMGELKKAIKCGQPTVRDTEGNYTGIDVTMRQVADEKAPRSPKRIFFSYSRYDRQFREELDVHFAPMKREGLIASWYDGELDAGNDIHGTIKKEIERADFIICLLSSRFMANDYIWGVEMDLAKKSGKTIIPISLKRCDHARHFEKLFEKEVQGFISEKQLFEEKGGKWDDTKKYDTIWIASEQSDGKRDEYYAYIVSRIRKMIEQ